MSAPGERSPRRGVVLLLAIVVASVLALCVVSMWRNTARVRRASTLDAAIGRATMAADSATLRGLWAVDSNVWQALPLPGDTRTVARHVTARGSSIAQLARIGWNALLVRGSATQRTGVRQVTASAEARVVIPLVSPVPMPGTPLTGANAWIVDPAATVLVPTAAPTEAQCRPSSVGALITRQPFPAMFDATGFTPLDADTVTDSLVGAFRLTRRTLGRPLRVTGIVLSDSALLVGAALRVTGLLVVRGSIRPAGGQLDVTGAVLAGDADGGSSGLGPMDAVRYDACAVRRAMAPNTRPGPSATWSHFWLF